MKIFVVSLKKSKDRRRNIEKQFKLKGLSFEFFDAIDGRSSYHPIFEKYNNKKRLRRKGYSLTPGEKGCFASHYELWNKCINLNEPIVILEDDIALHDNFPLLIADILRVANEYGFIRLITFLNDDLILTSSNYENFRVVSYKKRVLGTQGYVISPIAAKKLVDASNEWFEPVDDFIDHEWRHKAGVFCAQPSCISHLDESSDIGDRGKPKISIIKRLRREVYRFIDMILLKLYLKFMK